VRILLRAQEVVVGVPQGQEDARRAGPFYLLDEADQRLGDDLQPCPQGLGVLAHLSQQDLVPGEVPGHGQGAEDGLEEGDLVAQGLPQEFQAAQLAAQRALARVQHREALPVAGLAHHAADVLPRPLHVAEPPGLHAPVLHAETAGRGDFDEVKVVLPLKIQVSAGQVLGPLVVAGPVPPEGHGDAVHFLAAEGGQKALSLGHGGHMVLVPPEKRDGLLPPRLGLAPLGGD